MLPPRDTLALARLHAHPLDDRIRFDPGMHVYFVDGCKYPGSVSGVIHEYFPSFDPVATIDRYYEAWKRNKDAKYNPLINYLLNIIQLDDDAVKREIARNWAASGTKASQSGTDTHLQIELSLNQEHHNAESPEFLQYMAWRATHPTWEPYRTEWSIFDDSALLCGQIDSLWKDAATGELHMADWKRVGVMKTSAFRGDERGFGPMKEFANTNFNHYTLQQNLYTYMLEKSYSLKVASMCLVQIHPDLDNFVEWPLRRLDKEVRVIMEEREGRVTQGILAVVAASAVTKRKTEEPQHDTERVTKLRAYYTRLAAEL
jgi:hypothetical protein